ncbi:MAG: hypothetical protein Q4B13_09350 [Lautropia sp.]|nr:hypothetical protein [Lautropia sp.]
MQETDGSIADRRATSVAKQIPSRSPAPSMRALRAGWLVLMLSLLSAGQGVLARDLLSATPAPAKGAASSLPTSPGSLDYPRRKPGLWEIRNSAGQQLGLAPVHFCVGAQTDTPEQHLDRKVGKRGACRLGAFRRVGLTWVADSVCRDSHTTVVSQSTVTGDFQTHYRIDTVVLYSPPLANNRREDHEFIEARWLRACPAGQKPADLTIPGMGVLNMLDGDLRPESSSPHGTP